MMEQDGPENIYSNICSIVFSCLIGYACLQTKEKTKTENSKLQTPKKQNPVLNSAGNCTPRRTKCQCQQTQNENNQSGKAKRKKDRGRNDSTPGSKLSLRGTP
jgi:hypothetical protein